jgi:Bacterial PH domain
MVRFPSKVDGWLIALMVLLIGGVYSVVLFVSKSAPRPPLAVLVLTPLVALGLVLWSFGSTCYVIDSGTLVVKSSFLTWRIDIQSIVEITPTRSTASSPAMSLDRLAIRYRKGGSVRTILVSPRDKGGFLHALRAVHPGIRNHPGSHGNP